MDTSRALIEAVETLLTADATLISAMGGLVRLRYDHAVQDEANPYIVLDFAGEPDVRLWAMEEAEVTLTLWSKSGNAVQLWAMRDRVLLLLDQLWMTITEMGDGVRWRKIIDQNIPTDERDWWRCEIIFAVRYFKKAEVTVIVARP
jgi:hypothetical protein